MTDKIIDFSSRKNAGKDKESVSPFGDLIRETVQIANTLTDKLKKDHPNKKGFSGRIASPTFQQSFSIERNNVINRLVGSDISFNKNGEITNAFGCTISTTNNERLLILHSDAKNGSEPINLQIHIDTNGQIYPYRLDSESIKRLSNGLLQFNSFIKKVTEDPTRLNKFTMF